MWISIQVQEEDGDQIATEQLRALLSKRAWCLPKWRERVSKAIREVGGPENWSRMTGEGQWEALREKEAQERKRPDASAANQDQVAATASLETQPDPHIASKVEVNSKRLTGLIMQHLQSQEPPRDTLQVCPSHRHYVVNYIPYALISC